MNNQKLFDAHMHVGRAYKNIKSGSWKIYFKNAIKSGIIGCIMIPPCVPEFTEVNGTKQIFRVVKDNNQRINYYYAIQKDNIYIQHELNKDPFYEANRQLFTFYRALSATNFHAYFAPLVHPLFFDFATFSLEEWRDIVAIKIHPGSFGVDACSIDDYFWKRVENLNKPIILHTGYKNSLASDWFNVLQHYNIKVMFTHAMRLDFKTYNLIKNDERYCIGIAPYKRLTFFNNFLQTTNFLKTVSEHISYKKIIFDTDYPENFSFFSKRAYWGFFSDLKQYWSDEMIEDIVFNNANRFFNLKI